MIVRKHPVDNYLASDPRALAISVTIRNRAICAIYPRMIHSTTKINTAIKLSGEIQCQTSLPDRRYASIQLTIASALSK